MTVTFFKAVRPDGSSFHDPTFRWLPEDGVIPEGGWLVEHPTPAAQIGRSSGASASGYLSVSTVATDCTGFRWPCRLLEVEPVGRACLDNKHPSKRRVRAARVVRELDPHLTLGPQGEQVAALIERVGRLASDEKRRLLAAGDAAWDAARVAARDTTLGLVTRDLVSAAHYDSLTRPWRQVVGRIHPDDAEAVKSDD